jgi:hypothetical protein
MPNCYGTRTAHTVLAVLYLRLFAFCLVHKKVVTAALPVSIAAVVTTGSSALTTAAAAVATTNAAVAPEKFPITAAVF